ncbi:hypothetical protein [Variovorax sp. KK3]|uniref:hypothetical protein n=1 Tax=Variovorax sp. KK3 TaxID=1855728 RepID=UPI00097BC89E|nr:hypothetical protein [Variovorax sp. KK3]
MKKIKLNEEQWRTLEALRKAMAMRRSAEDIKVPRRLLSNGLAVEDRHGICALTELGLTRLNQGR